MKIVGIQVIVALASDCFRRCLYSEYCSYFFFGTGVPFVEKKGCSAK